MSIEKERGEFQVKEYVKEKPGLKEEEEEEEEEFFYKKRSSNNRSFKFLALLGVVLVYGSALLVSQINALYINHHEVSLSRHKNAEQKSHYQDDIVAENNGKIPLSFDLVRKGTFHAITRDIQWIKSPTSVSNDTGTFLLTENFKYTLKNLADKDYSKVIFEGEKIKYKGEEHKIESLVISDDLQNVLLITEKRHNWRHSFFANYWIYNVATESIEPLYHEDITLNKDISLAVLSPDSSKISFVLNNNVFIKDLSTKEIKKVTHDGGDEIFYGKPDWVYEEEVLESDCAMWWSPDSQHLSILRSNDTQVPVFPIPYFVQHDDVTSVESYPELKNIKYPKAGFPNPIVDIVIYDVNKDELVSLPSKDVFYNDKDISNDERLITEIKWVGNDQLLIRVTNRESDILKIFIVDCESYVSELTRSEDFKGTKTWFEITHNTLFVPKSDTRKNDGYIDTINVNGYDQLGYYSPPNSQFPKILSSGEWEIVGGPSAFDSTTNKVYFVATKKSSIERHLYSVDLLTGDFQNVTNVDEEAWYDVSFSVGSRYLLLNYNGPEVPYQKLIDLHSKSEEVLVSNDKLIKKLDDYDLPVTRFGEVNITTIEGESVTVNYKETLPLGFDPSKKYPLLMFVYGGPGSQLVQKTFPVASFSSIVAAELNSVVLTVDGRGTGFKGKEFRNIVRDNLGYYEVIDQISSAKHWIESEGSYIDPEKTAIWGWSYGGFMTLKTIERDAGNVFKYGMSVAPVTNWQFYDSIYTERYMHQPKDNPNYYNSSIHAIDGFKSVQRFLVMHGTGDDNVHFQNMLNFLDLLDLNGVENYDLHVFPDSDHSIRYHNANVIVYDKLLTWLKRAFNGDYQAFNSMNLLKDDEYDEFVYIHN